MRWSVLGKFALLVQPAVVAGLFFESTPSLTRSALTSNPISSLIAWVIVVTTILAAVGLVWRCFRGKESPMIHFMPEVLQALAASMGLMGAIAALAPTVSVTLVVAYIVDAGLIFWGAVLLAVERQDVRRGRK